MPHEPLYNTIQPLLNCYSSRLKSGSRLDCRSEASYTATEEFLNSLMIDIKAMSPDNVEKYSKYTYLCPLQNAFKKALLELGLCYSFTNLKIVIGHNKEKSPDAIVWHQSKIVTPVIVEFKSTADFNSIGSALFQSMIMSSLRERKTIRCQHDTCPSDCEFDPKISRYAILSLWSNAIYENIYHMVEFMNSRKERQMRVMNAVVYEGKRSSKGRDVSIIDENINHLASFFDWISGCKQ
jgi:hypothetical protein